MQVPPGFFGHPAEQNSASWKQRSMQALTTWFARNVVWHWTELDDPVAAYNCRCSQQSTTKAATFVGKQCAISPFDDRVRSLKTSSCLPGGTIRASLAKGDLTKF